MEYTYPKNYKPRSVEEQLATLKSLFRPTGGTLPEGAEALFVIPRWQSFYKTYEEAVEAVFNRLKGTRPFINFSNVKNVRETPRKQELLKKAYESQESEFLTLPAQFGLAYRGGFVEEAREVFKKNEVGLGAFEIACMLLTHPDRLAQYDDLWIDCAGDEYAPESGGVFSDAPCFYFNDENLKFGTFGIDYPGGCCGSASAFVASAVPFGGA